MARRLSFAIDSASHPPQHGLQRWQSVRTWARLIREAEALWRVDVRALHRLAALELGQLVTAMAGTKLATNQLAGRIFWQNDLSYWMPDANTHYAGVDGPAPAP
jgi:hypothetical protein